MKEPKSLTGLVRQMLGCDQQLMADHLGISRALLSKVDNGNRYLASALSLRVMELYQKLMAVPEMPAEPAAAPSTSPAIKRFVRKMQRSLERARKEAEQLTQNRASLLASLHRIEWLQQQSEATDEGMRLWLNVLRAKVIRRLNDHQPERLALADLHVKALEAAVMAIAAEEMG